LFFNAESIITATVEGITVDAAEVADSGEGDIHEFIEEIIHTFAAESDFAADRHASAEFPSGEGFPGASDDRFLPGDGGKVGDSRFESLSIPYGIAASHIDNDFIEFRHLHDVFVIEFGRQSRDNFGFIFIEKSGQDNTSLFNNFAALFADAGIFTALVFMSDASGLIASWANELDFASVKGHFLSNDAALWDFEAGFRVAFNFINALDDDFTGAWESGDNFTLLTLILTGKD